MFDNANKTWTFVLAILSGVLIVATPLFLWLTHHELQIWVWKWVVLLLICVAYVFLYDKVKHLLRKGFLKVKEENLVRRLSKNEPIEVPADVDRLLIALGTFTLTLLTVLLVIGRYYDNTLVDSMIGAYIILCIPLMIGSIIFIFHRNGLFRKHQ